MKHCKKCGAQLADDDDYCYFCGSSLAEQEEIKEEPIFRDINKDEDGYRFEYQNKTNGLATAGFVLAFFFPVIGLVLSILGLKLSQKIGYGRGMAISGIVVAIINMVLSFILYYMFYAGLMGVTE